MPDLLMRGAHSVVVGVQLASGRIEWNIFLKYLYHFVQLKPLASSRVLTVFERHVSHKSLEVIRYVKEHGITL